MPLSKIIFFQPKSEQGNFFRKNSKPPPPRISNAPCLMRVRVAAHVPVRVHTHLLEEEEVRSEEEVLCRRGPSLTYYGPALYPPLGGFGPKVHINVRGYEYMYFIPTKFGRYPSSDSVVKADYVFLYIHMH